MPSRIRQCVKSLGWKALRKAVPDVKGAKSDILSTEEQEQTCNTPRAARAEPAVSLNGFTLHGTLGQGAYGKVLLVSRDGHGADLFAMKVIKKSSVGRGTKQAERTMNERRVFEAVHDPFVVGLRHAFQTPSRLYLVLEYCPGGDLFQRLRRVGQLPEIHCCFYVAEVSLGIEHLHNLDVIYRDLKPENVVLDAEGHAKLTDFGTSKLGFDAVTRARSIVGTLSYLAPEMLGKRGYGKPVDWYALGCLTYELLTGQAPFVGPSTREAVFARIRRGDLRLPSRFSPAAQDVVAVLMHSEASLRLGSGAGGSRDLQNHDFFSATDWAAVRERRAVPPFVPLPDGKSVTASPPATNIDLKEARPDNWEADDDAQYWDGFSYK